MLDKSLFVSDSLIERTVKLADGTEHVLHFRELPAVEFRKFHMAEVSTDEEVQAGSMAKLIAASLCEPDGKPAMNVKQALKLKTAAAKAIFDAILEVNGFGEQAKKV